MRARAKQDFCVLCVASLTRGLFLICLLQSHESMRPHTTYMGGDKGGWNLIVIMHPLSRQKERMVQGPGGVKRLYKARYIMQIRGPSVPGRVHDLFGSLHVGRDDGREGGKQYWLRRARERKTRKRQGSSRRWVVTVSIPCRL